MSVGLDADALTGFVRLLLQELPNLNLDAAVEADARDALDEVTREAAQPTPESGRITRAFARFVGYVADAGKPVVTALLFLMAQHYGLPPQ